MDPSAPTASDSSYVASFAMEDESNLEDTMNSANANDEELREQDRFLPIANVARIMKKAIPSTGKISREAKECCQECVSEFISFITSEASDRCAQEKRKTINGEDILYAMSTLGFDNYVEPLKIFLQKYRESTKEKGVPANELDVSGSIFTPESGTIIATLNPDQGQQQNVMYSYPNQFISSTPLDND